MITAAEARELAGPTFEERVAGELEHAYAKIHEAAKNKRRSVNLVNEFWTRGGYNSTPEYKAAVKKLEEFGYKVWFHYEELQFVNMYTVVEW